MTRSTVLAAAAALALAAPAATQQATVTVTPGPQYEAGPVKRLLLGSNWRELWTTPLRVPVLDLGSFAGGLTPERQGGGNQSITLHMVDARGRGWVFRSVDKFPAQSLPEEFTGAPLGDVVADQISALHPAGSRVLPRLLEAVGILHVVPQYFVMPDDPRLGEFRETFAGMLGGLEPKAEEGPDDTPGFAGSTKVKGSASFLDDLEDSPEYRVDAPGFLRARLVDFLVGDPDRGSDQWRWARFGEKGDQVYRPVPRDRDWAFVRGAGLAAKASRGFYPKLVMFSDRYSAIGALTYSSHVLDRRLLTELTRADFVAAAAAVSNALTDEVIAAAVGDMPPELAPHAADAMIRNLRARRDRLEGMALRFYHWLATEVDVRATDEDDVADIERRPDGTLRVRLSSAAAPAANGSDAPAVYYDRVFLPGETREVRVFLHGGDDRARVHGDGDGITVRVIGGGGDDVLEDRAGGARFYDDRGDNELVTGPGTKVSAKPWEPPETPEGLRFGSQWVPDWGETHSWLNLAVDYGEAGLILGVGPSFTRFGFRRLPYEWQARASVLYAPGTGGVGGTVEGDYHYANSRRSLALDARATQFDAFRFYGYGNDSPELGAANTRVLMDRVAVHAAHAWLLGTRPGAPRPGAEEDAEAGAEDEGAAGDEEDTVQKPFTHERLSGPHGVLSIGPVFQWTRMNPAPVQEAGLTRASIGQVGARALFELGHTDRDAAPRKGYRLNAEASAFPAVWDAASAYGRVDAQATGYLPLVGDAHLAVRVGGVTTLGDAVPAFDAAFIGGRHTLRGFRQDRFAGDAAAFGNAELRVPLGTLRLLVNGDLGVFGIADAGRVWVDQVSPGDWHTGLGGGLWFAAFDRAFSLAWVHGERGRFYLWSGLPF